MATSAVGMAYAIVSGAMGDGKPVWAAMYTGPAHVCIHGSTHRWPCVTCMHIAIAIAAFTASVPTTAFR